MKSYNVSEVSNLLNVNKETVRRWIRLGKLKAERRLGRGGNCITSDAIDTMLKMPGFEKIHTDFVRMKIATEYKGNNFEITEDENTNIEISKEDLKGKLTELIAMRDCLNKQISDIICLL